MDSQTQPDSATQRAIAWAKRSPASLATLLLIWLAAAITLTFSSIAAWVGFVDIPNGDYWRFINKLGTFEELLRRNNEHPIVLGQLVFWLDWQAFDARGRFSQALIFIALAAQIPAFVWLAKQAGLKRPAIWLTGIAVAIILAINGIGNHSAVFQVSYVPGFTLAVWTFATFTAHARTNAKHLLAISALLACIGILSLASSVFVATIVAFIALWLGRRLAAAVFVLIAIAGWAWMLSAPSTTAQTGTVIADQIPSILRYFLAYFGTPFSGPINPVIHTFPNIDLAIQFGIAVDVLAAAALVYVVCFARKEPALLALAGIITFALLNAAASAVGRIVLGPLGAAASHYHVNVSLLYVSVIIVAVHAANQLSPAALRWLNILAAGAAAMLIAVLCLRFPMVQQLPSFHREMISAETALVAGVRDDDSVRFVAGFEPMDEIYNGAERLRGSGKWMFADAAARRIGGKLAAEELAVTGCENSAWSMEAAANGSLHAHGTFARRDITRDARHVLISDSTGTIVGFGLVPRRTSDVNPFVQSDGRQVDWLGHVRPGSQLPLTAWLSTGTTLRCGLGTVGQ